MINFKTWAFFVGELIVAMHRGIVFALEIIHERAHGVALRWSAGVLGIAFRVETSDIYNADGMGILPGTVGTDLVDVASFFHSAVESDQIVISDIGKIAVVDVP